MRLSIVLFGLACLCVSVSSPADVRHRAAGGAAARAHGTRASGPDGRQAWHAGGSRRSAEGDRVHARASGVAGPAGHAARGSRTTVGSDGTITRGSGFVAQGTRGEVRGGRRVQRSPDGSVQAGYAVSGQGAAGGNYSRSGSRTRSAAGERTASRQTSASGARGSYAGSTTRADGTLSHDSTVTGANGNTYQGQSSYTRGEGLSHSGTCTNAQGQTIQCK